MQPSKYSNRLQYHLKSHSGQLIHCENRFEYQSANINNLQKYGSNDHNIGIHQKAR